MFGVLAAKALSKSIHESWLGQPAPVEPSPENCLYCQLPPELGGELGGELADGAGGAYEDGAGAWLGTGA